MTYKEYKREVRKQLGRRLTIGELHRVRNCYSYDLPTHTVVSILQRGTWHRSDLAGQPKRSNDDNDDC